MEYPLTGVELVDVQNILKPCRTHFIGPQLSTNPKAHEISRNHVVDLVTFVVVDLGSGRSGYFLHIALRNCGKPRNPIMKL